MQGWLFGANDSAKTRDEAASYLRNTHFADYVSQNPAEHCAKAGLPVEQYDTWIQAIEYTLGLDINEEEDMGGIIALQTRIQQYVYIRSQLWQPIEEEEVVEIVETPSALRRRVLRERLATWVENGALPKSVLRNQKEILPADPNLVTLSNWLLEGQEEMPVEALEDFLEFYPHIAEAQWRLQLRDTPFDGQNPAEALIKSLPETHQGKLLVLKSMLAPRTPIE